MMKPDAAVSVIQKACYLVCRAIQHTNSRAITLFVAVCLMASAAHASGPSISSISPASAPAGQLVTISGSNFGSTTGTVTFNGTAATPKSWSSSSISVPVPLGATSGPVIVKVGSTSSNQVSFSVLAGPGITSISPTTGAVGSSVTITGAGFGSSMGSSSVKFNTTLATVATTWTNTSIVVQVPSGATTGNVTVKVGSTTSNGVTFTVTASPSISGVSPSANPVGSTVTISGSGFGSAAGSITFNGTRATTFTWGASTISVTVPLGATSGNLVVTTSGGVASNAVPFTVTVPTIANISPASAYVGSTVTINGTNFSPANVILQGSVSFNGVDANVTYYSSTAITVIVPQAATSGPVIVTDGYGNSSNGFNFTVLAPHISAITPVSGPGGTQVTLAGDTFGATQGGVTVTGAPATVISWSDTQILATVPAQVSTGQVIVTDSHGQPSNAAFFRVLNPGGIAVDQIVSGNSTDGAPTTPTFSNTSSNELLLAFVSASGASSSVQSVTSVSGAGLTWELVRRANTMGGTAEIWRAYAPTALANVTVTANLAYPNSAAVTVVSFTGIDTSGTNGSGAIGATAAASRDTSLPSVSLTTTRNNSLVFAVGNDAASATPRTLGPGQGMVNQQLDPCNIETNVLFKCLFPDSMEWVQQYSTIVAASGTLITVNDTAPAGDEFNLAAVEVLPTTAAAGSPQITVLSPVSGQVNTPVTISGSGFGATRGTSSVTFGNLVANVNSWSDSTIVVTVPLSAPLGVEPVVVTVNGVASNSKNFTVVDTPPVITITGPVDGAYTNATSVVVTGSVTSALPVTVTVEGVPASLQGANFTSAPVALGPGPAQVIHVVATDSVGTPTSATVNVKIDRTNPTITASVSPQANQAGWNNTDVTVTFTCADGGSGVATCPAPTTVTAEGANQPVVGTVTDLAGNTATSSPVLINIDKTAPTVIASANPPGDPVSGWNNRDVVVSYTCADSLSGIAVCPPPVTVSSEGSALSVTGQAVDKAGNSSTPVVTTLKIDKTPPVITVATNPAAVNGWNNSNVSVTFTCSDSLSGVASCPAPTTIASEGQNQPIPGQAVDVAGNVADVAVSGVTVSIDKTPPSIVQLSTPDHISGLHGGQVTAIVDDNFTVTQVVFKLNGGTIGTFTSSPFAANLVVPAGSNPGDTLTVTVEATDQAGNLASSSRLVRVAADGVIVGQVLDDVTSFPLQKAKVQVISATGAYDTTDDHGRYSLPANDPHLFLAISGSTVASKPTTTVEREVFVRDGVGTVPVDARLTALADPVTVGSGGTTITAGSITLPVPSGSVVAGTTVQLTPLSGQGLPGLLPLGWSPLAAFNLQTSSPATGLVATLANLPNLPMALASYDRSLHAWTVLVNNIQPVNGSAGIPVPGAGDYALVVPDVSTPPLVVPPAGDPLTGVDVQQLGSSATTSGTLVPAVLPASGGTAVATLGVQSPSFIPSGTVIQANLTEKFSLKSGVAVSEENRSEDIVLYSAAAPTSASLGAQFPVSPSQKFSNGDLLSGKVHLDFLAGREGVRGEQGGSDPLTLTDGKATLFVPGGALSEDTAVSLQSISLEDFIPTNTSMNAVQEMLVDFSGETLNTPAQLSIAATGFNPADSFLLAQVVRVNGVPHMVMAAMAIIQGQNLVSVATPGLPGVLTGGEYVFYDLPGPIGYVAGTVSSSLGPVQALVSTDSLAIGYFTGTDGHYVVPTLIKTVNVTATVPNSALAGSASVQPSAAQTVQQNILLVGTVTGAVVSPADQSLGVQVSTQISITTTAALDPASVGQATFSLLQGVTPVPLQAPVLSVSGTVLTYAPQNNLQPGTQYKAQVTGLRDIFQNPVIVPAVTFTTRSVTAPTFDPNAITFSFPDQNGNIHVSAPAGSLQSGTKVLIVDQSNAVVFSLTALNDGSLSGDFPGTINDLLQITVTDPLGGTSTFTRSQFVAADGTTAVGSGGGTVTGPGGIAMIIPQGALNQGTVFNLKPLTQDAFPQLPSVPGANFGSGIEITASSIPIFQEEVKLSFPKPANVPDGAFYYVYRQMTDQNNNIYFETIDHAFVQGTGISAKIVTASPPFCGFRNPYGSLQADANANFSPIGTAVQKTFFMWTFDPNQPGVSSQGLIVARVLQTIPPGPGQTEPTFKPYQGASVKLTDNSGLSFTNDSCATTAIFDPRFGGGSRQVTATSPDGRTLQATVNEVNGIQSDDATYDVTAGLEREYLNVGRVTITFPAATPPPPPPQIEVRFYTLDQSFHRVATTSIIQSGTPLVIAFKSALSVTSASINGQELNIATPDYLDDVHDPTAPLDFRANDNNSTDSLHRYIAQAADTYTLTVTAVSPTGGQPVTISKSFLVVAAGGSNNAVTPNRPPLVLSVIPLPNAKHVDNSALPQVVFSEPVTNIPSNVSLTDSDGNSASLLLIGIRPDGSVANPVTPADFVTSLTIQPDAGLKFNTQYTLALSTRILDRNSPPFPLVPFSSQFTTFGPQELDHGPSASTGLTRLVPIGRRAYAARLSNGSLSGLEVFDITDPTNPIDEGMTNQFVGRPADTAGLKSSPVDRCLVELSPGTACPIHSSGGPLVAVAAGMDNNNIPIPSNIFLYDVSNPDQPIRVGAVSATTSAVQDGALLRIVMKDQFIFTSTFNKGLQVIDAQQAISDYQQSNPATFGQELTLDGSGFALDAVVNTIPVSISASNGSGTILAPTVMWDLKVGDFPTQAPDPNNPEMPVPTHTLIVATGSRVPLVVADPSLGGGSQAILYPQTDIGGVGLSQAALSSLDRQSQLQQGRAVALGALSVIDAQGNSTDQPIAVIVGTGTVAGTPQVSLLTVVSMSDPSHPLAKGFVELVDSQGKAIVPTDVILRDDLAVVSAGGGLVLLVNLTDPGHPLLAGEISGIFGANLAISDGGILLTSSLDSAIGGVRTAAFQSPCGALRDLFKTPVTAPDIDIVDQLGWSLHASISPNDGFTVSNVRLGRRHMANQISVPYLNLSFLRRDTNQSIPARCELIRNSDQTPYVGDSRSPNGALRACDVLLQSRSRMVEFKSEPSNGKTFALQAKFLLDRLDGDPNDPATPNVPDSCLLVIQRYQFEKVNSPADGRPFEPNGALPTGKFFPTVEYQYFSDGSTLNSITFPQRLHLDARDNNDIPFPKAAANATFLTCDPNNPLISPTTCFTGFPGAGILHGENPLAEEQSLRVIEGGQTKVFTDFSLLHPGIRASVDNFHQSPQPVDAPDQQIDLPGLGFPGCPACVHIHWRWGTFLDPDSQLGKPFGIDPTFNSNGGNLFIPPGSIQDVDVAIVQAKGDETHPLDFKTLANGEPLLPSGNSQPVLWYAGTGHQQSDKFFIHGGAFSSLYVNKLDTPSNGLISIGVEHSNDIQWTVSVYSIAFIAGFTPVFIAQDVEAGALTAEQNFINLANPVSKPYALVIDLTDKVTGALSHNYYVFIQPTDTVIEP